MNLKLAPQDAVAWLPDALEVMDRNARIVTAPATYIPQCREALPWSREEDERLVALVDRNHTPISIARFMGRTPRAINTRCCHLRKEGAL